MFITEWVDVLIELGLGFRGARKLEAASLCTSLAALLSRSTELMHLQAMVSPPPHHRTPQLRNLRRTLPKQLTTRRRLLLRPLEELFMQEVQHFFLGNEQFHDFASVRVCEVLEFHLLRVAHRDGFLGNGASQVL